MASTSENSSNYWHILTVVVTFLATFVATSYIYKGSSGVPTTGIKPPSGVVLLMKDIFSYIPHMLVLFGIIADIFTYEGVYSIASLIGILSIPLNWLFGYLWGGLHGAVNDAYNVIMSRKNPMSSSGPANERQGYQQGGAAPGSYFRSYDGCNIQGLEGISSDYTIQTMVVTTTIMSYFMYDNITNRGTKFASATIIAFILFYVAGWFIIGDCPSVPNGPSALPSVSGTTRKLLSLVQGSFFGGIGYMSVAAINRSKLPSSLVSVVERKTKDDLEKTNDGKFKDKEGNTYFCLENGECFPDLCSEAAKKMFVDKIGETLGVGKPATAEDCPTCPTADTKNTSTSTTT
jgi:hypothetical protein